MASDQQKMYEHASHVIRLLSSEIPEEDIITQIGIVVVSEYGSLCGDII